MTTAAILGAILALRPTVPLERAERHAEAIQAIALSDEEAALLVVTGDRESAWAPGCVRGIGGAGTYGLGEGYWRWSCAELEVQAAVSLRAYREKGWHRSKRRAIAGYLGARSTSWPEAVRRWRLWLLTRERIACACCV